MAYKTITYTNYDENGEPFEDSYDIYIPDYEETQAAEDTTTTTANATDSSNPNVYIGGSYTTPVDASGNPIDVKKGGGNSIENTKSVLSSLPEAIGKGLLSKFTTDGVIDWTKLAGGAISALGAYQAYQDAKNPPPPTGYQGGIPSYTAIQGRAPEPAADARPGAGHQYFTGVQFANTKDKDALPAATEAIGTQLSGLAALNTANARQAAAQQAAQKTPAPITSDKFFGNVPKVAHGGLMGLAHGGKPTHPRGTYLKGSTDGMADKIPGTIDGIQPARLAHGEFVIPADVVSHLGNGNSDAGAQQLHKMMDRIRTARTGNSKQGKEINPNKFMPGGLAHYAAGGGVKRFVAGDTVPAGTTGTESNLSNWAGPYVTDLMGKASALTSNALANPQFYQGQLTAGPSALQNQAYGYAANLSTPTSIGSAANTAGNIATNLSNTAAYSPTTFGNQFTAPDAYKSTGSSFDSAQAQQYMNPYLQASLNPQLEEARRQSQITQMQNAAKMSSAGGFGGSRQAIMDAETQRNLGTNLANITGQGYNTAFNNAQQQFNADQQRKIQEAQFGSQQGMTAAQLAAQYGLAGQTAGEQSKQFGTQYGLNAQNAGLAAAQAQGQLGSLQNQTSLANLNTMANLGNTQQTTEQAGLDAAQKQFEMQKADPYKQLQFQQSMLQGMPVQAQSYNTTTNPYSSAAAAGSGVNTLWNTIFGTPTTTTPPK